MLERLKSYDFILIFAPLALIGFGTVMIYSASMVDGPVRYDVSSNYYLVKQLQWFGIGGIFMIVISLISYKFWQRVVKVGVLLMTLSLLGLFILGKNINNAVSWYDLGFMNFQPAEVVKIGLILYLSSVYSKKQKYISDFFQGVLPPLIITCIILGLIILQPDIGSAAVIGLTSSIIIMSSGIRWRHIFLLVTATVAIIGFGGSQMVTDERLSRFSGAYQPFASPDDSGYHLIQSYIGISTGGIWGEGLGQGVQKLGYLPEPHTDFIMAVIAEELGFIGVSLTIGLLALIILRGLYISWKCRDAFGALLSLGISTMIAIQALINLGAMSGLLPITGVTLPFVSYGGSSLVIMMVSLGILNNIARSVKLRDEKSKETNRSTIQNQGQTSHKGEKTWQN